MRRFGLHPNIGTCRQCIALSIQLTVLSALALPFALWLREPAIVFIAFLAFGTFATLSSLHLLFYFLRRRRTSQLLMTVAEMKAQGATSEEIARRMNVPVTVVEHLEKVPAPD